MSGKDHRFSGTIRTAQPRDADGIAAIYAHYVRHSTVTFEIAVPDDGEIAARLGKVQGQGWPWLVAEADDGTLAGYAYAAQYREREGWRFACEDSIYLAPELAGQGLGTALLARLIPESEAAGFRHMIAVIAGGSEASIALHLRAGFRPCGKLEAVGRKFGQWIDVHTMQRELGSGAAAPPGGGTMTAGTLNGSLMPPSLMPHRRALLASALIWLYGLAILFAMRRPPICECGTVKLWWGKVQSAENSQHLADWYSFSHVIHGLLFYAAAHVLWRKLRLFDGAPTRWALPIAVAIEASWELLENSPMIIDRYRAVTVSFGYAGDSIVNSMADIGWMVAGFWAASRLPIRVSIALAVFFELFTLAMIRDNLTLNVLMLVWPLDAVRVWQAGG